MTPQNENKLSLFENSTPLSSRTPAAIVKETVSTNSSLNRALSASTPTTNVNSSLGSLASTRQNTENINNNTESTVAGMNGHGVVFQIEQIREIMRDEISELRDEFMNENFKFKAEVLKEFMYLKVRNLFPSSIRACSCN